MLLKKTVNTVFGANSIMDLEKILILDFGGQYSKLIARRTRECGVFSEILSYSTTPEKIKEKGFKAIILSGGPSSVYEENAPKCDKGVFEMGLPVLGICYGAQLMANALGGFVAGSGSPEYGSTKVEVDKSSIIFSSSNIGAVTDTWMSHVDYIKDVPQGFRVTAKTSSCPVAAMEDTGKMLYAVQFHPEVTNTIRYYKIIPF